MEGASPPREEIGMNSQDMTLDELRADFTRRSGRSLAMPIAGCLHWTVAGVLGAMLPLGPACWALFICTGTIFPVGVLIGRLLGEDLTGRENALQQLMVLNVLMASLSWGIAIPFFMSHPASLPLSVGILAGTMWVPFSWIIQHWIGIAHAVARTVLIVAAWYLLPAERFVVIPAVIVGLYAITIFVLATRRLPEAASARA
jgi:hypothetical protein